VESITHSAYPGEKLNKNQREENNILQEKIEYSENPPDGIGGF
jgi:hypothetical protein